MVVISNILLSAKGIPKRNRFFDSVRLLVRGGSGGHGFPKFGGIGGAGGDIIVQGHEGASLKSIIKLNPTKRVTASHGENSMKNRLLGAKGNDVVLKVPIGITLQNDDGQVLGEINKEGDKVLVAKGGNGGNQSSGFSGQRGEKFMLTLDLKLIADVGLVGFPNAGKSTLLSIMSKAKPKIASYPFTTIKPNLGIVEYSDLRQISVADLPGLIEGAHANVGMGHKFLKHVERTKLLLVVVDVSGFQLGEMYSRRSCLETLILLNKELELYKEDLLDKPAILIVNKLDKPAIDGVYEDVRDRAHNIKDSFHLICEEWRPTKAFHFQRILGMSAQSNLPEEIETLKVSIRDVLDETQVLNAEEDLKLFSQIDHEYRKVAPVLI